MGDTAAADVAGAQAAGLRSVWIHRGRRWDPAAAAPPTATAGTIAEAAAVILAS